MSFFTLFTAGLAAFAPLVAAYTQPDLTKLPSGNAFSAPGLGESVQAGKTYTITWKPSTSGKVALLLLKGQDGSSLSVLNVIADSIDNTGSYSWSVPSDLTSGPTSTTGYGIELIADDRSYQYTTPFGITPASGSGSSSSADFTPTPRLGPAIATSRAPQPSTSGAVITSTDGSSYPTDSASADAATNVVVASLYTDASTTAIVPVTAAPRSTGVVLSSGGLRTSTTSRAGNGTVATVSTSSVPGAAATVMASYMGFAAAAGLAVLAL